MNKAIPSLHPDARNIGGAAPGNVAGTQAHAAMIMSRVLTSGQNNDALVGMDALHAIYPAGTGPIRSLT